MHRSDKTALAATGEDKPAAWTDGGASRGRGCKSLYRLRKAGRGLRACMAMLAAALTASAGLAKEPALTACYEDRPWGINYLGSGAEVPSKRPGYLIELLNVMSDKTGTGVRYVRYPWKRCLLLLAEGKVDAVIGAGFHPERQRFAVYPRNSFDDLDRDRAIRSLQLNFYVLPDVMFDWDGEQLLKSGSPYDGPVAAVNGYTPVIRAVEKIFGLEIRVTPDGRSGLMLVAGGRVDVLASDSDLVDPIIRKLRLPIRKLNPPFRRISAFLIISKAFYRTNERQSERIWDAIAWSRKTHGGKLFEKYAPVTIN